MNSDNRNTTMGPAPDIAKEISIKIFIAIVSGVIGFWLSLHPFVFLLPPYEFKFVAGLVFPLIVSIEWGWRYGLVSAIFGLGAQVLWIKGGWESVVMYTMFTLWIVWHGWSAEKFRKTGKKNGLERAGLTTDTNRFPSGRQGVFFAGFYQPLIAQMPPQNQKENNARGKCRIGCC